MANSGGDCDPGGGNDGRGSGSSSSGSGRFSYEPGDIEAHSPVEESSDAPTVPGAVGGGADDDDTVDGGGGDAGLPSTPRVFCQPESPPDTEENVQQQADNVFLSFVYERYTRDRDQGRLDPGTPSSPELTRNRPNPLSPEARIGRQLAEIGDDIQRRYQREFDEMIKSLEDQLTDTAASFDTFRRVAMRLFHDGDINWGRVVALFCFGYRIAVEKIYHGASGFVSQVVRWICRFLVTQHIAKWIADHGGWRSATHMAIQTVDWPLFLGLVALAASACLVAFRLSRR